MMTNIVGRVREALRGDHRVDADALLRRLDGVGAFLRAVDGLVPDDRLVSAHTLVERAGTRLALSRDHTLVALAGATGSGKSSLFNALAQIDLSPVGVRRPTTGVAHACVWGPLAAANQLLDWVGVLPRHRFVRESALDADDEAGLHGLVLLDLPDFDSVQRSHRVEVDRLLGLVDLVVWVVDPQKYADRIVHETYLREFHRHRDVTVVVLNQVDRLSRADLPRVVADLRRLLEADRLAGVPVIPTSVRLPDGVAQLRGTLQQAVGERQAALRRLWADTDAVADGLVELVGPTAPTDLDRYAVERLTDALADTAGVPAVTEAVRDAYRHRAAAATGWPLVRGWRRLRPDPLRRLHLPGAGPTRRRDTQLTGPDRRRDTDLTGPDRWRGTELTGPTRGEDTAVAEDPVSVPVPASSLPGPTAAQRSAVALAVRGLAQRATAELPAPWPTAALAAARSRMDDLPDELDRTVASTDLGMSRRPFWWFLVGGAQWLVTLAALVGLLWLGGGYALTALGLPAPDYPTVGIVPMPTVLLVGGLLAGFLLAVLIKPVVNLAARRAATRVRRRLRAAVAEVGDRHVGDPVRRVLHNYAEARAALHAARSDT